MGHPLRRIVMLLVVAVLLAGCRQQQADRAKQARLLAAENIELKDRLASRQSELQAARQEYVQRLAEKEQELSRCRQRIEQLQKEVQEGIAQRVNDVTAKVMDENARLRKAIELLTVQTQKLQGDIDQLIAERNRLNAEIEKLKAPPRPAEPNQP